MGGDSQVSARRQTKHQPFFPYFVPLKKEMLRLNLWSFVEVALAFPKLRIFQARRCAEPRHASTDDHYTQGRAGRAGSGHRGRGLKKRTRPLV